MIIILCNRLRRANSDLGGVGIIVCASDEELGFERSTLEGRHSIIDDSHLRHFWRDVLASQEDLLRLLRLLGQCDRRQRLDADGVDLVSVDTITSVDSVQDCACVSNGDRRELGRRRDQVYRPWTAFEGWLSFKSNRGHVVVVGVEGRMLDAAARIW